MSFPSVLYTLLIGPLELFFEVLFSMANRVIDNPGLSIVFLSLAMNFLVLPLYKMADAMQADAQAVENKLAPVAAHIKKTFTGDERYMILQTYYRQNNYKPTDALKGSVSLLLEIPFFMAAYNFLSGLPLLHGASLGPIQNLGTPDQMLVLGGIAINVLPILMTAINLISSAIYTRGSSFKSKLQLYIMAGLFLVLLYDSPSGLVFYWTLNNLFSLAKNIFMKLKNPEKVFCVLVSVIGACALAAVVMLHPMPTEKSQLLLCCLTLMLQLPLIIYFIRKHLPVKSAPALTKQDHMTFWVGGLFLTVLTGLFIPSGVISASPEEFLDPVTLTNPLLYILSAALTAAGFFLIWFRIFYMLAKDSGKKWMNYGICALSAIALVDFMCFGKEFGTMSATLVFDERPVFGQKLLNLVILLVLSAAVFFLWKKNQKLLRSAVLTAALAAAVLSAVNMDQINKTAVEKAEQQVEKTEALPVIPMSRNGKNVVVLMLDRAVSTYVPYLMDEKPELKEQLAGFTYYPNTISFGGHTNIAAPALFGGYEYTPEAMNRRDTEALQVKHDEALKVMPVSFLNAGFEVTVCDPPYAGYNWVPDLRIYSDHPEIHTYNSMQSFYPEVEALEHSLGADGSSEARLYRNFFCYSIMKISPVLAQPYLYDGGDYNQLNGTANAENFNHHFNQAFFTLHNLSRMTEIDSSDRNTFLMLTNDTAHEPVFLRKPDYVPSGIIDTVGTDRTHGGQTLKEETEVQIKHYQINMAAFLQLGRWFDYLREQDVFDNTRIILVSDHGYETHQRQDMFTEQGDDLMFYNPLLLVKDFNSTEFSVDNTFMTNADTPGIALEGLVQEPVNPFTGNPIDNSVKSRAPQQVFVSHIFDIGANNGNTFLPDPWYSVHDNIFDLSSWDYLGVR